MNIQSQWHGPVSLIPCEGKEWIFKSKEAQSPGIYIWTVHLKDAYRVNYVGMSASNIFERQMGHISAFLSGRYTFYCPDKFAEGKKKEEFDAANDGPSKFIEDFSNLSSIVIKNLQVFDCFFAPIIDNKKRNLERIESSIMNEIRKTKDLEGFLDNARLSCLISDENKNINVEITSAVTLEGIPSEFKA